ncbi:MAG: cupredoxin domain-containing protein [Candidatus Eiseniibacteriota bacterium]
MRDPTRVPTWLLLALGAVAACAFAWNALPVDRAGGPREVVLVARDMAFALPGQAGRNPTLRLKAGERIRLVLENRDPGMKHDLASAGLGIRTEALAFGESGGQILTVPRRPGEYDYFCSFHAQMMRGRMVVE